jgi:hypothetical protein
MNDDDRALCAATAGLLRAGSALALWGLALALISGLVLALTGRSLPSANWAAFAIVALARSTIATEPAMDRALATLGLRRVADGTRPLADRVLGARQLMQRHGIAVIAQTIVFAMALAMQDSR